MPDPVAAPIFSFMFDEVVGGLTAYVTTTSANMATVVGGACLSLYGLYLIMWIWQFMVGNISTPAADFFKTYLKGLFIFLLATNVGWYSDWILDFFWTIPSSISSEVASAGSSFNFTYSDTGAPAVGQAFDKLLQEGLQAGLTIWNEADGPIKAILYALITLAVWIATIALLGYAAALILIGYFALAIILALGPLFIIFALFDATKSIFESWLRGLINYSLYSVVLVAAISLVIGYFTRYSEHVSDQMVIGFSEGVVAVLNLIAFTVIGVLLVSKADDIAASIAGGVSLNASRLAGAAGSAANTARGGLIKSRYDPSSGGYKHSGAIPAAGRVAGKVAGGVANAALAMFRTNGISPKK